MRCGAEEEIHKDSRLCHLGLSSVAHGYECCTEQAGEEERMGHPPMAPKVAIVNAEGKSDHIEIRHDGTDGTGQEDRPGEYTMCCDISERERHECMGEG